VLKEDKVADAAKVRGATRAVISLVETPDTDANSFHCQRYAYLIGQTEIFSHFINLANQRRGKKIDIPLSPSKVPEKSAYVITCGSRQTDSNISVG